MHVATLHPKLPPQKTQHTSPNKKLNLTNSLSPPNKKKHIITIPVIYIYIYPPKTCAPIPQPLGPHNAGPNGKKPGSTGIVLGHMDGELGLRVTEVAELPPRLDGDGWLGFLG